MNKLVTLILLSLLTNLVFAETKDLGSGSVSATPFLQVTTPSGSITVAKVYYLLNTNDTTNWVVQGGTEILVCAADSSGFTAGSRTGVGNQNEAGQGTSPAVLLSSISFSVVAGVTSNTCEFRVANNVLVGTATQNIFTYSYEMLGSGSWVSQ